MDYVNCDIELRDRVKLPAVVILAANSVYGTCKMLFLQVFCSFTPDCTQIYAFFACKPNNIGKISTGNGIILI